MTATKRRAALDAEEQIVLRSLGHVLDQSGRRQVEAYAVAARTAHEQTRTAYGSRRRAFGEQRTRKLLASLIGEGLVGRQRHWDTGHLFSLTDEGRVWLAIDQ
jgi:hypothetical protein